MIRLSPVVKTVSDSKARISVDVNVDGVSYPLWYEVDERYGDALCDSRSDAFVTGLFLYALNRREDISYETPMTDELKLSIEQNFVLAVRDYDEEVYPIRLIGPTAPAIRKEKVSRLTGISCGVDSLYTVIRRMVKEDFPSSDNYIAIFNHHASIGRGDTETLSERRRRFADCVERAKRFSAASGIPLIIGDTNYNTREIPGLMSEGNATFVNMFCAMAMQNLFTHYLIASAGGVEEFGYYLRKGFSSTIHENYDLLTTAAFSSQSLRITVDGLVSRDNKIKYLAEEPLAQRFLDVCLLHQEGVVKNGTNDCPKCMYTILELMALGPGVLERFDEVFDVEYVKSHKYVYLADMIRGLIQKSIYAEQCWPRRYVMGFVWSDYVRAFIIVGRKMIKKVCRFGKNSYSFSPDGK